MTSLQTNTNISSLTFDSIILGFLGIMTLRELIAMFGVFPRDKKLSFLIYNNYDSYLVKETLKALGLEKKDITNTIYAKKITNSVKAGNIGKRHLIQILSQFLICIDGNAQYGVQTVISTKYYITTAEATYYEEYLDWMCHLLGNLILEKLRENGISNKPDFIITPKGGNTNLGKAFANRSNSLFITSKYISIRGTYVSLSSGKPEFNLKTNYEGAWELINRANSIKNNQKLYGIVVDCNTATGEQIEETLSSFNSLVKRLELPIEPVKNVFTLYRAIDNEKCDIDTKFKEHDYRLYRYCDLSESNKEEIYKQRGKKNRLDVHYRKDVKKIDNIIKQIRFFDD